jgi:hypothetical protein
MYYKKKQLNQGYWLMDQFFATLKAVKVITKFVMTGCASHPRQIVAFLSLTSVD